MIPSKERPLTETGLVRKTSLRKVSFVRQLTLNGAIDPHQKAKGNSTTKILDIHPRQITDKKVEKSRFKFDTWGRDEDHVFESDKDFSWCSLILIGLFIASFILENRSQDLGKMGKAILPFIRNKTSSAATTNLKFDRITEIYSGIEFSVQQLNLVTKNFKEPMADKSHHESIFHEGQYNEFYNFTIWRMIQTSNLFMGASIWVKHEPKIVGTELKENYELFIPSDSPSDKVAKDLLDMQVELESRKIKDEEYIKSDTKLLFYNFNLETADLLSLTFENSEQDGFKKSLKGELFLPRVNDPDSKYFSWQLIVWLIRIVYFLDLLYSIVKLTARFLLVITKTWGQMRRMIGPIYLLYLAFFIVNIQFLVEYIKLLNRPILFKSEPVQTQETFNLWKEMFSLQKKIYLINGFQVIFLLVRVALMLRGAFRGTLSLVFNSLRKVSAILASFFALILLLMAFFVIFAMLNMNKDEASFSNFTRAVEIVALTIFQKVEFEKSSLTNKGENSRSFLYTLYFFLIFSVFNTLIIPFFLAIMSSSYSSLRMKYQHALEAQIAHEQELSVPLYRRLWQFLTFSFEPHKLMFENPAGADHSGLDSLDLMDSDSSFGELSDSVESLRCRSGEAKHSDNFTLVSKIQRERKASKIMHKNRGLGVDTDGNFVHDEDLKGTQEEIVEDELGKNNLISFANKLKMKEIALLNLESLGVLSKVDNKQYISACFKKNRLQVHLNNVRRIKLLAIIQKLHELTASKSRRFFSLLLYLFYIYLFIIIVGRHLFIVDTFRSWQAFISSVEEAVFKEPDYTNSLSFVEITTMKDIESWLLNLKKNLPLPGPPPARIKQMNEQILRLRGEFWYRRRTLTDYLGTHSKSELSNATHFLKIIGHSKMFGLIKDQDFSEIDFVPSLVN